MMTLPTSIVPIGTWLSLSIKEVIVYSSVKDCSTAAHSFLMEFLPVSVNLTHDPVYGVDYALYRADGSMCAGWDSTSPGKYFLATNLIIKGYGGKVVMWEEHLGKSNDGLSEMTKVTYSDGTVETVITPLQKTIVSADVTWPTPSTTVKTTTYNDGTVHVATVTGASKGTTYPLMGTEVDPDHKNLEWVAPDGQPGYHRRRPRATLLFDIHDMPREHWVWMVESRRKMTVHGQGTAWSSYSMPRQLSPCGFRDRVSAWKRLLDVMEMDAHNVALGIVEYRVAPHYLGYQPSKESWFRETYTRLVVPGTESTPADDITESTT